MEGETLISDTYSRLTRSFLDLFTQGKIETRWEKVRFHLLCASERNKRDEAL